MKDLIGPVVTFSPEAYFRTVFANSQIENWRRGLVCADRCTAAVATPDISGAVALRLIRGLQTQH